MCISAVCVFTLEAWHWDFCKVSKDFCLVEIVPQSWVLARMAFKVNKAQFKRRISHVPNLIPILVD